MEKLQIVGLFVLIAVFLPQNSLSGVIDLGEGDLITEIFDTTELVTSTGPTTGPTTKPTTGTTKGTTKQTDVPDTSMATDAPVTIGEWTVNDEDGNPCMRMKFAASMFIKAYDKEINFELSPDADAAASECSKNSPIFRLTAKEPGENMSLSLKFEKEDKVWEMEDATISIYMQTMVGEESMTFSFNGENEGDIDVKAVVGKYYTCDEDLSIDFDNEHSELKLTFTDFKFQPFAQLIEDNGYGDEFKCGDNLPKETHVGLIVGVSLVVLIALGIILGVVVMKCRSKQTAYKPF